MDDDRLGDPTAQQPRSRTDGIWLSHETFARKIHEAEEAARRRFAKEVIEELRQLARRLEEGLPK